jgi:methionyl-tRNA formyltransferase
MLVSLYFDQIIRAPILSLPGCTSINLHPSLLPAYGGSSPTFHAMARGETATGITIHELTDVVDAGRILYQQDIVIDDEDTQFSLYRRCTEEFLQPLLSCIEAVRSGDEFPHMTARQSVKASYYTKISREELTSFLAAGRKFI